MLGSGLYSVLAPAFRAWNEPRGGSSETDLIEDCPVNAYLPDRVCHSSRKLSSQMLKPALPGQVDKFPSLQYSLPALAAPAIGRQLLIRPPPDIEGRAGRNPIV